MNVGINSDRMFSKTVNKNTIGGFSPNTGKSEQLIHIFRDFPIIFIIDDTCYFPDTRCFHMVESNIVYKLFDIFHIRF